ncbi:MAG: alpha/beta fold hydrolase [Polyangiales bacterium]
MQLPVDEGVSLHVQALGSGAPVVLLHGLLLGNLTTWYMTAAPAIALKYRAIMYDLRGHGLSSRASTGYDLETMSRDLERVIVEVAGGPAAVVGHSYGGAVALTLALRAPSLVTKLILVEAPLPASRLSELDAFVHQAPDSMIASLPAEVRALLATGGRRARRFIDAMQFFVQRSSVMTDLRSATDIADEALAALVSPLTAIYGTSSSLRPVGGRLERVVPGARSVQLTGGHWLPMEHPAALTAAILEALDG